MKYDHSKQKGNQKSVPSVVSGPHDEHLVSKLFVISLKIVRSNIYCKKQYHCRPFN